MQIKNKNWKDIVTDIHYIPASWDRQKDIKSTASYCFAIKSFCVPLEQTDSENLQFFVILYFFDSQYNQFFGRRWIGPRAKCKKANDKTLKINYNQNVYFHSAYTEEKIFLVAEIVCVKNEDNKKVCGWGLFRYSKKIYDLVDVKDSNSMVDSLQFYAGSSRALLFLEEPIEEHKSMKKKSDIVFEYQFRKHQLFDSCAHLVPADALIGMDDNIPGIIQSTSTNAVDSFINPKIAKSKTFIIDKIAINFYSNFEAEIRDLLNDDRLLIDNKSKTNESATVNIVEQRLQVGVHNGWVYIDEPQIIHLIVSPSDGNNSARRASVRGHRRNNSDTSFLSNCNTLCAKNPLELELLTDSTLAIVFVLEYVIGEPKDAKENRGSQGQRTVPIRWVVFEPFSGASVAGVRDLSLNMMDGSSSEIPDKMLVFRNKLSGQSESNVVLAAKFHSKEQIGQQLNLPLNQSSVDEPLVSQKKEIPAYNAIQPSDSQTSLRETKQESNFRKNASEHNQAASFLQSSNMASMQMPMMADTMFLQQQQQLLYSQLMLRNLYGLPTPGSFPGAPTDSTDSLRPIPFMPGILPIPAPLSITPLVLNTGRGLSRAAYARLYSAGFPELLDRSGDPPMVIDTTERQPIQLSLEQCDPLQCNEIILQFLAFARIRDEHLNGITHKGVYFTFQFYRFPQFTTEKLVLHQALEEVSSDSFNVPFILQRVLSNGEVSTEPPGYQVKYNIDSSFLKPGEGDLFIDHLSQQILHIDVWDAESLLLIGSCGVELRNLCRQGREAVQATYEIDVMSTEYPVEGTAMTGDLSSTGSIRPIGVRSQRKGRLHLRLANIGYKSDSRSRRLVVGEKKRYLVEPAEVKFSGGNLSSTMPTKPPSLQNNAPIERSVKVIRANSATETYKELNELLATRHSSQHLDEIDGDAQMRDNDRQRKLARMQAVRQTNSTLTGPAATMLSIRAYRSDKQERAMDLRTIDHYRRTTKREKILDLLGDTIATEHCLFPSFGVTDFFEFKLKNPRNCELIVSINVQDSENSLHLVQDSRELRALKAAYGIVTPIEENLLQINREQPELSATVFLRPREFVYIPFKYLELQSCDLTTTNAAAPSDGEKSVRSQLTSRTIKVFFLDQSKAQVALLRIRVSPQPSIIDQTFRFYQPEHSFLKRSVRLPPFAAMPNVQLATRCTDPNVITNCHNPVNPGEPFDVSLKVAIAASPSVRSFLMAVYVDAFLLRPAQIWQFFVHSLKRIDVVCTEGQNSNFNIFIKGTNGVTRRVTLHSSHPQEICAVGNGALPFSLTAGAAHELTMTVRCSESGSRMFHLNLVDCDYRQVIHSWLVCVECKPPEVSKAFEVQLPVGGGRGSNKRIPYTNPYPSMKRFQLVTNRPEMLQFVDNEIQVGAGQTVNIGLRFVPVSAPITTDIFVFLNDEDGKTEETFAMRLIIS